MLTKSQKKTHSFENVDVHFQKNRMAVVTEEQFQNNPDDFLALRKAGMQVGIKGANGRIKIVVGTGPRSAEERKKDQAELRRLRKEIGVS